MEARRLAARTLRRRVLGSLAVAAVVIGLAGGIATSLVAGAQRTSTAAERFIRESRVLDLMVTDPTLTATQADEVRRLPGVQGVSLLSALAMFPEEGGFLNITASIDGRWGVDVDVSRLVRGRTARAGAADEIVLGEATAKSLGVDVGDVVRFRSWSPEQIAAENGGEAWPESPPTFLGPTLALHVVGISRHPADLSSDDPLSFFTAVPPDVWSAYRGEVGEFGYRFLAVDLGEDPSPADAAAVSTRMREIVGPGAAFEDAGTQVGRPLMTTLDFVASAMLTLAAAVALGGFAAGGLLVLRTATRAAEDTTALGPLGMTAGNRARAVMAALAPCALASGALVTLIAVIGSACMPFGLARRAEPDPGLHVDLGVVLGGALATALIVVAVIAATSARAVWTTRPADRANRPSVLARFAPSRLSAATVSGLDLALGPGRGGVRIANRAAIGGVALGTLAGVGAFVVGTSVDHLFSSPRTYGWTWDYAVPEEAAQALVDDPTVESVGLVTSAPLAFDGRPVVTRGISSLKGELPLMIVDGRRAEPGEVVLGARTMADLDVGIGDTVTARGPAGERELRVVGQAVFAGLVDEPQAGWGAAMPLDQLTDLGTEGEVESAGVVTLADGVDPATFEQRMATEWGAPPDAAEEPVELVRLREVEAFPWVLAAFLVAVGFVATAHALIVTTRRRRGDLAVLRSMGLARGGVYTAVSVQAAALAVLGSAIGVPLGIVAGRLVWQAMARSLGVVVTVAVPWPAIVTASGAACVALAMLALLPARSISRTRPAAALRAE